MVITGRTFDNGVLCTCEQNMIVPKEKRAEAIEYAKEAGAYVIDDEKDAEILRETMFPNGALNKNIVGASPPPSARWLVCRCPRMPA